MSDARDELEAVIADALADGTVHYVPTREGVGLVDADAIAAAVVVGLVEKFGEPDIDRTHHDSPFYRLTFPWKEADHA